MKTRRVDGAKRSGPGPCGDPSVCSYSGHDRETGMCTSCPGRRRRWWHAVTWHEDGYR